MPTTMKEGERLLHEHDPLNPIILVQERALPDECQVRPRLRRATRVCTACHTRKVGCDLVEEHPCTNCQKDGFECEIRTKKRRLSSGQLRAPNVAKPRPLKPDLNSKRAPDDLVRSQLHFKSPFSLPPITQPDNSSQDSTASSPSMLTQHEIRHQIPHYNFMLHYTGTRTPDDVQIELQRQHVLNQSHHVIQSGTHSANAQHCQSLQDIAFIKEKGVLSLPAREVMDEMISSYFKVVYPFFPILDKQDFLHGYKQMRNTDLSELGPSLLLLQAVLFASSSVRRSSPFSLYTKC